MRNLTQILAITALLAFSTHARADFYIVVNEANKQASLTQKEALYIFMGRTRSFADGAEAKPFDMQRNQEKRAGFYHALSGMNLAQVTSYWARLMFSGRSLPPTMVTDEATMAEVIKKNPNAIGWMSKAPTEKGLRAVLVLTEQP